MYGDCSLINVPFVRLLWHCHLNSQPIPRLSIVRVYQNEYGMTSLKFTIQFIFRDVSHRRIASTRSFKRVWWFIHIRFRDDFPENSDSTVFLRACFSECMRQAVKWYFVCFYPWYGIVGCILCVREKHFPPTSTSSISLCLYSFSFSLLCPKALFIPRSQSWRVLSRTHRFVDEKMRYSHNITRSAELLKAHTHTHTQSFARSPIRGACVTWRQQKIP